jgi:hypothetical protein
MLSIRLRPLSFLARCVALMLLVGGGAGALSTAAGQAVGVGAFSRMGFDARGLAMGNALVASAGADVSPYYNPALLPNASRQRLSGSVALLSFDRQLQSLEFTTPLGPTAGVGLGLIHAGVTDIDGRDRDGRRTETLSTDEYALALSFGNRFAKRVSVGVSLTLYQSDVVPETNPVRGFGLDLGVTYQVTSQLRVAGSVNDLLAKYEWSTGSVDGASRTDRFPVRVLLGSSYDLLDGRLRLLGELESRFVARDRQVTERIATTTGGPRRETRTEEFLLQRFQGRLGAEYRPIEILALRAGLDRIGVDGTDGLRPGAGFGLRQEVGELDLRVSYGVALEPYVRSFINMGTIEIFL